MRHLITALALVVATTCTAQAAPRTPDPEMDALRAELRELKKAEKRRQKLAELRQQIEEMKK